MSLQIKRIQAEQKEIIQNPSEYFYTQPLEDNIFIWHFTIKGPNDSVYENGLYHGKIELSQQYPLKPPDLYFLNQNGRFEIKEKICLNFTKFHPENWNPSFTIRMLLEGIVHHFPIDDIISGVGSLHYSQEERKKLAELSHRWKCEICGCLENIFNNKFKKEEIKQQNEIIQEQQIQENDQEENRNIIEQQNLQYIENIKQLNIGQQKIQNILQDIKCDKSEIKIQQIPKSQMQNLKQSDAVFKAYLERHLEIYQSLESMSSDNKKQIYEPQVRENKIDQKQLTNQNYLNYIIAMLIVLMLINIFY